MVRLTDDQRPPGNPAKTPFVDLMQFLGKPGIMDILFHVGPGADGPIRFTDLQAHSGIPRNTLVNRLKELVAAGFLERQEYDKHPPRVEYEPSQKVVDLIPGFREFHEWCNQHYLVEPKKEGEEEEVATSD